MNQILLTVLDPRMLGSIVAVCSSMSRMNLPVNPPEIVTIKGDEFRIDTNRMEPLVPYILKFRDSKYLICKNDDGSMAMDEVP